MKQTVQERAQEMCEAWGMEDNHGYSVRDTFKVGFVQGANWQAEQSTWISVEDRLPEENENIIIMCEHGAIFNGTYCNTVWFCMDGYINDTFKGNSVYSSMVSIPPLWKPIAWMPIPKFDE
ncbi:DUF551 domain-containing protein [Barnesiella intestinihominis]|uniref:DUF551 domain-containing protein n=1 Tax=Barnesiella intestinihominis TaxID=487174 RepID=UPI003AB8FD52